jgi:CheY-like chemotaxis protein
MADEIRELEAQSKDTEIGKRPRVLLVDDDAEVGTFLSSRLAKCGVDMLYAADGMQGYQIACRGASSAIISDYSCPLQSFCIEYGIHRLVMFRGRPVGVGASGQFRTDGSRCGF